ncbi:MAG: carbon monoxide dehydrogenase subunit G [Gemmatimonadetes bacterium]|nr:carbon monoxide dehydrogenase subunit G [Gemmatimonadota bacterium]NNK47350.1 carbon monoxide dehydrogenase subunit G [Gemmatimonadota bacterium]
MLIESEFTFDFPPEVVYEGLLDPDVLASALPGTDRLELVGEDRYEGEMEASVGPVTAARFSVVVELKEKVRPESFDMHVDGKGKAGFVNGIARVAFEETDGGTVMKYRADLQVGGRVASVGQRLLESVGKMMSKQGLEAVNRSIMERQAPTAAVAGSTDLEVSSPSWPPATRKERLRLFLVVAILLALVMVLLL